MIQVCSLGGGKASTAFLHVLSMVQIECESTMLIFMRYL